MNKIGCFDRQEGHGYRCRDYSSAFSRNSIHLSLCVKHCCWSRMVKISSSLDLPRASLQLLAFLLAMTSSLGSLSLTTASAFTSATFPWLLIWSLHRVSNGIIVRNFKIHLLSILFFLTIGIHAFFKLSSLLTVSQLPSFPFSFTLQNSREFKQ